MPRSACAGVKTPSRIVRTGAAPCRASAETADDSTNVTKPTARIRTNAGLKVELTADLEQARREHLGRLQEVRTKVRRVAEDPVAVRHVVNIRVDRKSRSAPQREALREPHVYLVQAIAIEAVRLNETHGLRCGRPGRQITTEAGRKSSARRRPD